MTYLLKNGKIYDGTGADAFLGDILVRGGRIEKIGEGLICDGAQVIDLQGLSVSSGFMDAHSHNDWFAIRKDPRPFFEPFIRQGITSFITGNCGLSATGFTPDTPYLDKIGGAGFSATAGMRPACTRRPARCSTPQTAAPPAISPFSLAIAPRAPESPALTAAI